MRSTWTTTQPFGRLFKFLITVFILSTIVLAVSTAWVKWSLSPPRQSEEKKIFVIKQGESAVSFSNRLEEEGLVKSAIAFRIYLKVTGLDKKVQAGSFSLATNMTGEEVAQALTKGRLDKWVRLIEGLRKEEVAAVLAKEFSIDKDNFLNKAIEGYLFPDTYLVPLGANEEDILAILDKNFQKKITADLIAKGADQGRTKEQMIILASIVEREARNGDERPIIAGILIKRWKEGMHLAADATIQYALGYSEEEKSWWRKNLTEDDLKIDSPYNTRLKVGLPPGPISNPGLSAITAVANPKETDYYFYIHDKDGVVHYGRNFAEHQENISKYLR